MVCAGVEWGVDWGGGHFDIRFVFGAFWVSDDNLQMNERADGSFFFFL